MWNFALKDKAWELKIEKAKLARLNFSIILIHILESSLQSGNTYFHMILHFILFF